MINQPVRRISTIYLDIDFPIDLNEEEKRVFINIVKNCPVSRSLHPDVKIDVNFKIKGSVIDLSGYWL